MEQNERTTTPRIYVASLSDYNAGTLHGRWIEADQAAADIHAEIAAMLAESKEPGAEEWAIHDYEGFGGLALSEYESIDRVAEVAPLLIEHGDWFGKLVEHFGGLDYLEDAKNCIESNYYGVYDSLTEYVEQFLDECYGDALKGLPDLIRHHIDYDGIARDMELGGDLFAIGYDGKMHIFSSDF